MAVRTPTVRRQTSAPAVACRLAVALVRRRLASRVAGTVAATLGETLPVTLGAATPRAAVTVAEPNRRRMVGGDVAVAVSRRRVAVSRVLRAAGPVTTAAVAGATPVVTAAASQVGTRAGTVVAERPVVSRVVDRRRNTADSVGLSGSQPACQRTRGKAARSNPEAHGW